MNAHDPASNDARHTRSSRYILIAAGNADELYRTSMLLQRFAYPVCTAQSAKQAFDIITVSKPALVITDLDLPDASGLDLLRKLGSGARALPVILLLPTSGACVEARDVEIGGSIPCLTKPVEPEDLFRLVQAAVETTPRSTIRIPTRMPIVVNRILLDVQKGEYVTDLSEDGLYVRTLKPLRKGERITISLVVDGRTINADASVLYEHRPSEGLFREPGMAVKFEQIAPDDREHIRKHVHEKMTQGIARP